MTTDKGVNAVWLGEKEEMREILPKRLRRSAG